MRWLVKYITTYYGGPGNHNNGKRQQSREFISKAKAEGFAEAVAGVIIDTHNTEPCSKCGAKLVNGVDAMINGMCPTCYSASIPPLQTVPIMDARATIPLWADSE